MFLVQNGSCGKHKNKLRSFQTKQGTNFIKPRQNLLVQEGTSRGMTKTMKTTLFLWIYFQTLKENVFKEFTRIVVHYEKMMFDDKAALK